MAEKMKVHTKKFLLWICIGIVVVAAGIFFITNSRKEDEKIYQKRYQTYIKLYPQLKELYRENY